MSIIDRIEKGGRDYIADLVAEKNELWLAMCREDGVDPTAMFIVFSDDNIFAPFYDKTVAMLQEARAAYVPGGGYVGLKIKKGKAVI